MSTPFPYFESIWVGIVLALVVSGTSYTITMADVFEPFRKFIGARNAWLGKLFSCFYCLSHWVAFLLVAIYRPQIIPGDYLILNLAVSAFFIVQLALYFTGLVFKAFGVILPVKAQMLEAKAKKA